MAEHELELFELVTAQNVSLSPFVWRVRCALLHKGLPWQSIPLGFTDPRKGFKTFPALRHRKHLMDGSWDIACYLEHSFRDTPGLYGPAGEAHAALLAHWVDSQLLAVVFRTIVADIHDAARPMDQAYFRQSREARLGDTLEQAQARQRERGNQLGPLLEPARRQFASHDFLHGAVPLYGDFCLYGMFQWSRGCSDYLLLKTDDPVSSWLTRMDGWVEQAGKTAGAG
jgi:glutathione S-transferase